LGQSIRTYVQTQRTDGSRRVGCKPSREGAGARRNELIKGCERQPSVEVSLVVDGFSSEETSSPFSFFSLSLSPSSSSFSSFYCYTPPPPWLVGYDTNDRLNNPGCKEAISKRLFLYFSFSHTQSFFIFFLHSLLEPQVLVYSFFSSSSTSSCRCTSASYEIRRLLARTRNSEF
jgi:hypothetical protein